MRGRHLLAVSALACTFGLGTALGLPYHTITVDGSLSDWSLDEVVIQDAQDEGPWGPDNDLWGLSVTWDAANLFFGYSYEVQSNGVILYVDLGLPYGETNFEGFPIWPRRFSFPQETDIDLMICLWDGGQPMIYAVTDDNFTDITMSCQGATVSMIPGDYETEIGIPLSVLPDPFWANGGEIRLAAVVVGGDNYDGPDAMPENPGLEGDGSGDCLVNMYTVPMDRDGNQIADDYGLVGPQFGDIVINEVLQNPDAVYDEFGEWFEIYNSTAYAIDLLGWTIADLGVDSYTFPSSYRIPGNSYAVLGCNDDPATNGGVDVDVPYAYSDFMLANGDDEIILSDNAAAIINRIAYDGGPEFPDPTGASMSLMGTWLDSAPGANWREEAERTFGDGDFGTPGQRNHLRGDLAHTAINVPVLHPEPGAVRYGSTEWAVEHYSGTCPLMHGNDVLYRFTLGDPLELIADLLPEATMGGGADLSLVLLDEALACIDYAEDAGVGGQETIERRGAERLDPGTYYLVAAAADAGPRQRWDALDGGSFMLRIALEEPSGLPAGDPANALKLTVGTNPLRGPGRVSFALPAEDEVHLGLFDLEGRRVAGLLEAARLPGGTYTAALPAGMGPGIYFLRLETTHAGARCQQVIVVR